MVIASCAMGLQPFAVIHQFFFELYAPRNLKLGIMIDRTKLSELMELFCQLFANFQRSHAMSPRDLVRAFDIFSVTVSFKNSALSQISKPRSSLNVTNQ